ncbi:hypothetical protein RD1_1604 [Roseobacter denitrificans OCh 114]|uniref:Uncharacterized protein n=1 Tax=Roseobacter denitrificans (strain ATCC 33942 / OCh 114) TaxID=375451 RepID=Q169W2_ROSDO|nr:hypothetical protein RD1_1604 [Roseobacter denitrificans OCh 114]
MLSGVGIVSVTRPDLVLVTRLKVVSVTCRYHVGMSSVRRWRFWV